MTQSPGRDSPGSSGSGSGSRHSTASLDSGRASGYHLGGPRSAGALTSSPRCSISSLGSHDRPADLDIVHAWLTELQFEEYFPLFASAGYDLATITRMTPEDLTAIGKLLRLFLENQHYYVDFQENYARFVIFKINTDMHINSTLYETFGRYFKMGKKIFFNLFL